MKHFFQFYLGYIVTANEDGSIPLNAKFVCKFADERPNHELLKQLLDQANECAKGGA